MPEIDLKYLVKIADGCNNTAIRFKLIASIAGHSNAYGSPEFAAIAAKAMPEAFIWAIAYYLKLSKRDVRVFLKKVENDPFEDYNKFF